MKIELLNKIGNGTALLSFGIGISLLLAFYITGYEEIPFFAYFYLIFATLFNLVIFFALVLSAIFVKENKVRYLKTAALMLLNIPIAIACFFIGISLL